MFQRIHDLRVLLFTIGTFVVLSVSVVERSATGKNQEDAAPTEFAERTGLSEKDTVRIRSLILKLGSESFQIRKSAERELRQCDEQILAYLKTIETPSSVEIRSRLRRVVRGIESRGLTEGSWIITTDPLPGETTPRSNTKALRFYEDGTFSHSGPSGKGAERWEMDRATNTFRLSYNNNYAVYEGTFNGAGDIVGKAINSKGREWQFRLTSTVKPDVPNAAKKTDVAEGRKARKKKPPNK